MHQLVLVQRKEVGQNIVVYTMYIAVVYTMYIAVVSKYHTIQNVVDVLAA